MAHTLVIYSREARRAWFKSQNTIEQLRQAGHCAAKAHKIMLDAVRGDRYAINWILSVLGYEVVK